MRSGCYAGPLLRFTSERPFSAQIRRDSFRRHFETLDYAYNLPVAHAAQKPADRFTPGAFVIVVHGQPDLLRQPVAHRAFAALALQQPVIFGHGDAVLR
jgi:hypothetical protein